MLVDHTDAQFDGIVGIVDLNRTLTDLDLALVLRVEAVEDIHQRALARAVFAQESQDLSRIQRETAAIVGKYPREAFGYVARLQDWDHRRSPPCQRIGGNGETRAGPLNSPRSAVPIDGRCGADTHTAL